MDFREHASVTSGALKRWFIAQLQDSAAVACLWLIGLLIIRVPWAPMWAALAAILQFIPHLGPVMALIGPAVAAVVSGGFMRLIYVFILYAVVAVTDGLVLQPYLMRRTAKVPIWASILAPIVLGMIFSFWGVLLAAPLLAVLYAYRTRHKQRGSTVIESGPDFFLQGGHGKWCKNMTVKIINKTGKHAGWCVGKDSDSGLLTSDQEHKHAVKVPGTKYSLYEGQAPNDFFEEEGYGVQAELKAHGYDTELIEIELGKSG